MLIRSSVDLLTPLNAPSRASQDSPARGGKAAPVIGRLASEIESGPATPSELALAASTRARTVRAERYGSPAFGPRPIRLDRLRAEMAILNLDRPTLARLGGVRTSVLDAVFASATASKFTLQRIRHVLRGQHLERDSRSDSPLVRLTMAYFWDLGESRKETYVPTLNERIVRRVS